MNLLKAFLKVSIPAILLAAAASAPAAQLSTDARTAIPHDVQQLVAIDYHAMENSTSAMDLRDRVMPPELKRFEEALHKSGLNENHDVEQLAFALFRPKEGERQAGDRRHCPGPILRAGYSGQLPQAEGQGHAGAHQQGLSAGQDRHGGLLCRSLHHGLWR